VIGKEILTTVYMSHLYHVIISHAFSLYSLVRVVYSPLIGSCLFRGRPLLMKVPSEVPGRRIALG